MAKDPKNTNIFSTLGASNHSENERQKEDYYATDPRFIDHLIEKEPWLKNPELKILKPSAGEGILVDRFFELTGNRMDAYDLIKRRNDIIEQNYFTADFSNKYDVILTNPPYLKDTIKTTEGLSEYILKALKEVKVGGTVIMFLKTLHLESKVRYEKIYKHYPPSKLYVYADRISCYKNNDTSSPQGAISYTIFMWTNKKEDGTFDKDTKIDWIRYK